MPLINRLIERFGPGEEPTPPRPHAAGLSPLRPTADVCRIPQAEALAAVFSGDLAVIVIDGRPLTTEDGDVLVHESDWDEFLERRVAKANALLAADQA